MQEIIEQLKVLETPNSFFFKKKEVIKNKVEALERIGSLGRYWNIHSIFKYLFSKDIYISLAAGRVIHRLFEEYNLSNLTSFYQSYRRLDILCWADIESFQGEEKATLLKIATFNHCGYDREKALLELIELEGIKALPYIILRSADWVNKIHKLAVDSLLFLLKEENINYFIKNIPSIYWMYTVGRRSLGPIASRIIKYLTDSVEGGMDGLFPDKAAFHERYFFYQILFEHSTGELLPLLNRAANDSYYMVRGLIISRFDRLENQERVGFIKQLLRDSSRLNRVRAFWQVKKEENHLFKEELQLLLTDKSSLIRGSVQPICQKLGLKDLRQFYLDNLNSDRAEPYSLLGLAECGSEEDITVIKSYLTCKKAPFRLAALMALKHKVGDEAKEQLIQALLDDNGKVRKRAVKLLSNSILTSDLEQLQTIFEKGKVKNRISVIKLLSNKGGWAILPQLLLQLESKEEKLRNEAWQALSKWQVRYTLKKTKQESERVREAVDGLSEETIARLKELRFYKLIDNYPLHKQ